MVTKEQAQTAGLARLYELATVVLPPVQGYNFNITYWRTLKLCGTVACACGWAAFHKPFIEEGFEYNVGGVRYQSYHGYEAAAKFFNIRISDAIRLFFPSEYPNQEATTKQEVIDRIEQFITSKVIEAE